MDMPTAKVDVRRRRPRRRLRTAVAILVLQALAAAFFIVDSITDVELATNEAFAGLSWLAAAVALALVAAVVMGAVLTRQLFLEARKRDQVIALARGALAEVVTTRFTEWRLSRAEADVGLFALKGCSIAEIAAMRGSAEGTVRAQLSQVYAKAGVSSQSAFIALFVEELLI